jgi:hypothetical protein
MNTLFSNPVVQGWSHPSPPAMVSATRLVVRHLFACRTGRAQEIYTVFLVALAVVLSPVAGTQLFGDDTLSIGAPGLAGLDFFEKRIRPVLIEHCYQCHSSDAKELKGGLRLDSRDGLRHGGESGQAVVPGSIEKSLLISAIRYEDFQMPPAGKLPDHVIADFVQWIEMGAPDPRDDERALPEKGGIDAKAGRDFWAFQPLKGVRETKSRLLESESWSHNTIDRFVLAKLQENALEPNALADRYTLLRRVYLDLIGLPPEPGEIISLIHDDSPNAYEKVVDRLLASPHFGERWGRHWLDLAQYADSVGIEQILPNRGAWRYRDYVIGSLNDDKPLDRFFTEQIAGDLLPYRSDAQRAEQIVATQFLTQGPINLINQFKEQLRMDIVDNQIDKVGRVLLGLTLGCARCHDHKFDPITQTDYYALAGILHNVQVLNGFRGVSGVLSDCLLQPIPETADQRVERERLLVIHQQRVSDLEAKLQSKENELARLEHKNKAFAETKGNQNQIGDTDPSDKNQKDERQKNIDKLNEEVTKLKKDRTTLVKANDPRPPVVLAASEPTQPVNARINIRGIATQLGEEVPRGLPRLLALDPLPQVPPTASGRLQLAQWLVHHDNPIVPRVFVNRLWHHLMGTGIVRTVDNFGLLGEHPSHPELLDYLADRLVERDWRIKPSIRDIVLSRTYRLSSDYNPNGWSIDPDNRSLWRHRPRRLDGIAIRDSVLKISGDLSTVVGGPTLPPADWNDSPVTKYVQIKNVQLVREDVVRRRSVYLPLARTSVKFKELEPLLPFDFPSPDQITGARQTSTVPTQMLFLMNAPFFQDQATILCDRLLAWESGAEVNPVNRIYLTVFGRPASSEEIQHGLEFVRTIAAETSEAEGDSRRLAFVQLCHAMLISTEFLTYD